MMRMSLVSTQVRSVVDNDNNNRQQLSDGSGGAEAATAGLDQAHEPARFTLNAS